MKVLFLDIDGVLNSTSSLAQNVHLDPSKVCMLYDLVRTTDTKVIISSTWRNTFDYEPLRDMLWITGFMNKALIVGKTPSGFNFTCRGEEIQSVLDANKDIEKYAIVDDDADFLEHQQPFVVNTNTFVGLCWREIDKLRELLT